jgi:PAS domain S-box-containing protein
MLTSRQIRVLIVDDDEDDFHIISDYMKTIQTEKFVIDWCNSYEAAVKKITDKEYDIYFVDYRLGNKSGLDLLQEVNAEELDEPIVLLTGKGSKDIDIKAMQSGATDYLIKSELNSEKLERCIRYSLDRMENLKELRTRENKYRNLFESSKDAVFIANEKLEFIEANAAALELFVLPGKDWSASLYDFIKDPLQKQALQSRLGRGENISDMEIDILAPGGEIPCLLAVSFLASSNGQHLVHGILHDMSNIKKAETANIQAQKLAANERLMRTLAHEIRNPLNNISLSIDHFQLPYENTDKQQRLVEIIQRNSVRINQIITELLDLTRPQELIFEHYSLQQILDESLDTAIDRINLHNMKLSKSYPPGQLMINADKTKLCIAFTNILINAIEAMEPEKGELTVIAKETPECHTVVISDNGKGISPEYLSKLFEPFFTLKQNGVGLGLATSYSIIQSHKGSVQVDSQVGKGTKFTISFNKAG